MDGGLFVGVDHSRGAQRALDWALTEARLRAAPLTVLRVVPPLVLLLGEAGLEAADRGRVEEGALDLERRLLAKLLTTLDPDGVDVQGEILHGSAVAEALVDRSAGSAGLVVGSRGRGGFASLLLGSVGHQLLHHARCPVVVVADRDMPSRATDRRVVVGVDGSTSSRRAVVRAAEEARLRGARLDVVTVQEPPPPFNEPRSADSPYVGALWGMSPSSSVFAGMTREELERRQEEHRAVWMAQAEGVIEASLAGLPDEQRPSVVEHVVAGDRQPARRLLDAAEGAELLVVGSRGRGGFAGLLLGSVSQQCVEHATVPVMVLRDGDA